MKYNIFLIIILVFLFSCSEQKESSHDEHDHSKHTQLDMENPFPFKVFQNQIGYVILVETESKEVMNKYDKLWENNGYSGNGYCWEGHITQILEKEKPELVSKIKFNPEAGSFGAYIKTKSDKDQFIKTLLPIFTDLKKLEEFVKKADASRVDN